MKIKRYLSKTTEYINLKNNGLTDRLLFLMEEKGVSGYFLSKQTGVSKATISRIISKRSKPSETVIRLISDYFNVSRDWLLTGKGGKPTLHSIGEDEDSSTVDQRESKPQVCNNCEFLKNQLEDKNLMIQGLEDRLVDKDKQIEDLKNNLERVIVSKDEMLLMKDRMLEIQAEKIAELEDLKKKQTEEVGKQKSA